MQGHLRCINEAATHMARTIRRVLFKILEFLEFIELLVITFGINAYCAFTCISFDR